MLDLLTLSCSVRARDKPLQLVMYASLRLKMKSQRVTESTHQCSLVDVVCFSIFHFLTIRPLKRKCTANRTFNKTNCFWFSAAEMIASLFRSMKQSQAFVFLTLLL